jgi:fido (protein-threonine AMPylation protein)
VNWRLGAVLILAFVVGESSSVRADWWLFNRPKICKQVFEPNYYSRAVGVTPWKDPLSGDLFRKLDVRAEWHPTDKLLADWREIDSTSKEDFSKWDSLYAVEPSQLSPDKRALFEKIQRERMENSTSIDPKADDRDTVRARKNWREADLLVRRWVIENDEITLERILELNRKLGQGLKFNHGIPGKIRKQSVGITFGEDGIFHPFMEAKDLSAGLGLFFAWLKENEPFRNPIEFAALAGERFVSLHPFIDGNGRTTRLICDWILMRHGLPPAIYRISDIILGVFPDIPPELEASIGSAEIAVTHGLKRFHDRIQKLHTASVDSR